MKQEMTFDEKIKYYFKDLVVDKSQSLSFFNTQSLPSYIRDWFVKKFQDKNGQLNLTFIQSKINELIPRKDTWPLMLETLMNQQKEIRILGKITVVIDVSSNIYKFEMLDVGIKSSETIILSEVVTKHKQLLLS